MFGYCIIGQCKYTSTDDYYLCGNIFVLSCTQLDHLLFHYNQVIANCILLCVMIQMTASRSQWSLRTFVHINLCTTLFIAQLIFLIGIDNTSNNVSHEIASYLPHDYNYAIGICMLLCTVVVYNICRKC